MLSVKRFILNVTKKRLAKLVKVASKVIGVHLSVHSFVFNACKPHFLWNNDLVEAENYAWLNTTRCRWEICFCDLSEVTL